MNKSVTKSCARAFIKYHAHALENYDQIARFFRTGKARTSVGHGLDRIYPGWRGDPIDGGPRSSGVIEWIMQNITLTSIHSDSNRSHPPSCVRHTVLAGLRKHAVNIDLHPRDLL